MVEKMFKTCLIFLLSFFWVFLSGCSSNKIQGASNANNLGELELNLPVKKYTLDNGLRLLVVENNKLPIVSYYTFFDVGGRFESREAGTTGATHFLEHMMFKGAKKYKSGEFEKIVEGNGGRGNAYTTFDSTVYYESFPSKILNKIIDLEADRMGHLTIETKSFESERLVVKEERKMRYENSPMGKLYLSMMKAVFKGTPYGGSVIGDVKDLDSLTQDQIQEFFKTFYAPNNAIIVVVGDVSGPDVFKQVKRKYGNLKSNKKLADLKKSLDKVDIYDFKEFKSGERKVFAQAKDPIFIAAYPGVKLNDRKAMVYDLLTSMLSGGISSYMHQKYVQAKKPLFSSIGVSNYNLKNSGVFFIKGDLLPGTSLSKVKRILKKDVKRYCRDDVLTLRELQKTRNNYLVDYYSSISSNSGLASFLGMREAFFGDYEHYKKELREYSSISLDEIKKECKNIFKPGSEILLHVWNKNPRK
jgi:zinc protease